MGLTPTTLACSRKGRCENENVQRSGERVVVEMEVEMEVKLGKEKYNERSEEREERGRYRDDETDT